MCTDEFHKNGLRSENSDDFTSQCLAPVGWPELVKGRPGEILNVNFQSGFASYEIALFRLRF
jgi:hypothetical protein